MQQTHQTNITLNKWNLEDLLTNKRDHNKQLAYISTAINLVNDDSDIEQMKAILSLLQNTIYDMRTVSENDADRLAEMIAVASKEIA